MSEIVKAVLLAALAASSGLSLAGCSGREEAPADPKRRLTEYISRSFAVKGVEDRRVLVEYLTGDARTRLAAWSDEQFRQAFIDSKRQFVKLAFREIKAPSPKEVSITYDLIYVDKGKSGDAKITNRKLAQMVQEQGKWFISEVKNLKELVEYRDAMALP